MLLNWAVLFLVIAIAAGILGFSGIAKESAWIAKVIFLVFIVLWAVSYFMQPGALSI